MTNRHSERTPGAPTKTSIIVGMILWVAVGTATGVLSRHLGERDNVIGFCLGVLATVMLAGTTLGQLARYEALIRFDRDRADAAERERRGHLECGS